MNFLWQHVSMIQYVLHFLVIFVSMQVFCCKATFCVAFVWFEVSKVKKAKWCSLLLNHKCKNICLVNPKHWLWYWLFKMSLFSSFFYTTEAHLLCLVSWGFEFHCDLLVASFIVFFSLKQLYTLLGERYIKKWPNIRY